MLESCLSLGRYGYGWNQFAGAVFVVRLNLRKPPAKVGQDPEASKWVLNLPEAPAGLGAGFRRVSVEKGRSQAGPKSVVQVDVQGEPLRSKGALGSTSAENQKLPHKKWRHWPA